MSRCPKTTLILGGARSGKSAHAEGLLQTLPAPWFFVATAQAFDEEMKARIALHSGRRGNGWRTLEAPLELAEALGNVPPDAPVLIDCLTLWLSNLLLGEHDIEVAVERLEQALDRRAGPTIMVSNEVGLSIVPDNALGRRFRDEQGRLNQRMAALASRVVLIAAGLPLVLKHEDGQKLDETRQSASPGGRVP